jgi:topoisomerase-4 subunit B
MSEPPMAAPTKSVSKARSPRCFNDWAFQTTSSKPNQSIDGSDIREGLTAIISVKIPEDKLEYEGQTKGKLGTPEAGPVVGNISRFHFTYYSTSTKLSLSI